MLIKRAIYNIVLLSAYLQRTALFFK